jgi:hypothetical protein
MDETTPLDTEQLRNLLHSVADSRAPVCTVNIARARQAGGRQRAVRRLHLPWVAPIAAAVAVTVIAVAAVPVGGHARSGPPASTGGQHALMRVPTQFTAQTPYVSFGWLPPGFTADGLAQIPGQGPTGTELDLQAVAPGGWLMLRLFSAGQCRIGGPIRAPVLGRNRTRASRSRLAAPHKYATYPFSSTCLKILGLVRRMPRINGGPAYASAQGGLFWEYGRDAWTYLTPAAKPPLRSGSSPVFRQTAAGWQLLRKVASRLRFDPAASHPLYGFSLTSMPALWGTGYPTSLAMLHGHIAADGWSTTGPAADPDSLGISVWPAPGATPGEPPLHCNFVPGQSSNITVDGARAMLRVMDQVGKHWQALCVPDVDGLSVYIDMDVWSEGSASAPLPGWPSRGVLAVFHHMHLLGPDVADWTAYPQQ